MLQAQKGGRTLMQASMSYTFISYTFLCGRTLAQAQKSYTFLHYTTKSRVSESLTLLKFIFML